MKPFFYFSQKNINFLAFFNESKIKFNLYLADYLKCFAITS